MRKRKKERSLESFNVFSTRELRILHAQDVQTIDDLMSFTKWRIYWIPGLGAQAIVKTEELLASVGETLEAGEYWSAGFENRLTDEKARLLAKKQREWAVCSHLPLSVIPELKGAEEGLRKRGIQTLGDLVRVFADNKKARAS